MEKINEKIYQANIDLVDKNRLLEEDKKILMKRIERAIEILENNDDEHQGAIYDALNILKGRYIKDEGCIAKSSRTNK